MPNSGEFRLALLAAEGQFPRWIWEPLQAAVGQGHMTLATVASVSGLPKPSHSWIVEAYARWEWGRYLPPDSLLEDVDVAATNGEQVFSFGAHEVDGLVLLLTSSRAEVVLVTPGADQANLTGIEIPVWKFQFGASERQHTTPGLLEVVHRSPSSVSLLEISPADGSLGVLETIVARTDPRSWVRNQLGLFAKASDLLRRWIPPQTFRHNTPSRLSARLLALTAGETRNLVLRCYVCWRDSQIMHLRRPSTLSSGSWRSIRPRIFVA